MTDIIKPDVLAIAPELSTLSDAAWVDLLEYVNEFDMTCFDTEQVVRMARIFLCAHMGTLTKRANGGAAGPLVDEQAGGVRRSYGTVQLNEFSGTSYGLTLWTILNASGAHGPFLC